MLFGAQNSLLIWWKAQSFQDIHIVKYLSAYYVLGTLLGSWGWGWGCRQQILLVNHNMVSEDDRLRGKQKVGMRMVRRVGGKQGFLKREHVNSAWRRLRAIGRRHPRGAFQGEGQVQRLKVGACWEVWGSAESTDGWSRSKGGRKGWGQRGSILMGPYRHGKDLGILLWVQWKVESFQLMSNRFWFVLCWEQ